MDSKEAGKRDSRMNHKLEEVKKAFLEKQIYQIEHMAEELRYKEMPEITDALYFIYDQTGSRVEFENVYFCRRRFLAIYGMMAILHGRQEDIQKLENVILSICEERCWALPAHVDLQNNQWEHTVELYASETAQALTEITFLLHEKLSTHVIEIVNQNVDQRVLNPYFQSEEPYAWWEDSEMNWNSVCLGSIGCITLYRYQNQPDKMKNMLKRVSQSIYHYIGGYQRDGVCKEGLDYWTYGMYYYCAYAQLLYEVSGGKENLIDTSNMTEILTFQQKCYLNNGITLSFSDGSRKSSYRMGLVSYLSSIDSEVHIPDGMPMYFDEDTCCHWAELYRDVEWTKRYLADEDRQSQYENRLEEQKSLVYEFQDSQWLIAKGEHGAFAAKGGNNGEPHNHNDIGSFIYIKDGTEYIMDLGAGEYTKDYFHEKRYSIFCNSSESHNVPIINEQFQRTGEEYRCTHFHVNNRKEFGIVDLEMKIGAAYEADLVEEVIRHVQYDVKTNVLQVTDEFHCLDGTECLEENLATECSCQVEGNKIYLYRDEQSRKHSADCVIVLDDSAEDVRIVQKEHQNHEGILEEVSLIQWTVKKQKHEKIVSGKFVLYSENEI